VSRPHLADAPVSGNIRIGTDGDVTDDDR
jgi:hypothetical protein